MHEIWHEYALAPRTGYETSCIGQLSQLSQSRGLNHLKSYFEHEGGLKSKKITNKK